MSKKKNIIILVSGRGSNMKAVIDARPIYQSYEILAVLSDKQEAQALLVANEAGIPTAYIPSSKGEGSSVYADKLIQAIEAYQPDLIVLAGFMKLLAPKFIQKYGGRIINIHPSLLPAFPGLHAQKQAFDYGVRFSGCTVHFVDEGCDTGPIILQSVIPVLETDTLDSLSDRILAEEHKLLPKAIDLIAKNKVKMIGRKIHLSGVT